MSELNEIIAKIFDNEITKAVLSKPASKQGEFKKITVSRMPKFFQIAKHTEKQVFHENVQFHEVADRTAQLMGNDFLQLNAWDSSKEYYIVAKNGRFTFKARSTGNQAAATPVEHNRKKQYLLPEGQVIEPLVDMGIFTKEGKVINAMYDKYKQINRLIEIIDDSVRQQNLTKLNIIDFGCGKSYLTFIVYYYLTEIKKIETNIIGLDLKKDVIEKCNKAAQKYGYKNLRFELGDINGYKCPFDVDMVITLHACDTATDFALYNAISWGAKMIFSVP